MAVLSGQGRHDGNEMLANGFSSAVCLEGVRSWPRSGPVWEGLGGVSTHIYRHNINIDLIPCEYMLKPFLLSSAYSLQHVRRGSDSANSCPSA